MEQQEKIEQYLRGKMSPGETAAFENEVAADPALARELELQRLERELLLQVEAEALRAKIRELRAAESTKPETAAPAPRLHAISGWRRFLAAAAAVAALAVAVWYFTYTPVSNDLIAEGYRLAPPDYASQLKGGGVPPVFDPNMIEILVKRDRSRAETAVQYFSGFQTTDPQWQQRAMLNRAHALILAGNFEAAVRTLENLEQNTPGNDDVRQAAQYFRALALLGKADAAGSRELLQTIAGQPAHDYHNPAAALLQIVNN